MCWTLVPASGLTRMAFPDHMDNIFDEMTDLTSLQRHTIKERYRFLMEEYRQRCRLYAVLFYVFRITMTVGSLAVPALLSIQNGGGTPPYLYWLTWSISLAVTTANGIMTLFKLDKRFFTLHATAERLRSETWQFIQLSGRYSGHHGGHHKPNHANQFVYYCSQLEKINMKRVDDEYVKGGDDAQTPPPRPAVAPAIADTLVPTPPEPTTPSPAKNTIIAVKMDATPIKKDDTDGDSIVLIEDADQKAPSPQTVKIENPVKTVALSLPESPESAVPSTGPRWQPVLSGPSPLPQGASVGIGTPVQSGSVQQ